MTELRERSAARAESERVAETAKQAQARVLWRKYRWVVLALGGLLLTHGVALVLWAACASGGDDASPEITLGRFQFVPDPVVGDPIVRARFQLHVSLLEQGEAEGRRLLDVKRFRVQQQIEQLLRRAHGGDFEDPALADLRRLVQETVNRTLGKLVIEEVMITDLMVERREQLAGPAPGSEGRVTSLDGQHFPRASVGGDF